MPDFETLRQLGLTKTDVHCYVSLLMAGPAEVKQLSVRLDLLPTNLYGVLEKLVEQGYLTKFKMTTQPALFMARPLNQALREHYMYQRRIVAKLCTELGISLPPALPAVLKRNH